eukprot:UN33473
MDKNTMFHVTDRKTADIMSTLLKLFAVGGSMSRVTDGTSDVGGNVSSFANEFTSVNAVEKDKERFDMLEHNMRVLGAKNVDCKLGDYTEIHNNFSQEIIFLDPGFGGSENRHKLEVSITLNEIPIALFCNMVAEGSANHNLGLQLLALKLPLNYNWPEFDKQCKYCHVVEYRFKQLMFLILDYRHGKDAFQNLIDKSKSELKQMNSQVQLALKKIKTESLKINKNGGGVKRKFEQTQKGPGQQKGTPNVNPIKKTKTK